MTESERAVVRDALRVSPEARTPSWTTVYGLTLIGATFAAMGLAALMQALSHHVAGGVSGWVPWALAVAGLGALVRGCVALGPMHAEPPLARWLVPTPVRRWIVLRSRAVRGVVLAALAGLVVGLVVAVASHPGGLEWLRVGMGLGAGVLGGAASWTVALRAQSRSRASVLGRATTVTMGLACAVIAVGVRAGWAWNPPAGAGGWGVVALAAVSVIVLAVSAPHVPRWVDAVRAADLAEAGLLVSAAAGSATMLDAGMFDVRRAARRLRRRGRARSAPSRANVWADLVVRDLRGGARRWPEVAAGAALVVPAVMLGELFGDGVGAAAVVVAAWCAASRAAEGLVTWLGSSSLWRILPQHPAAVTACFVVAPIFAASVVAGVGAAALGLSWGIVPAGAAGVVAGIVRRSKAPDMQLGTMVDLGGMGELPLGVLRRVTYGFDLVLVIVVAGFALGPAGWTWAALLAVGALVHQVWTARPGA